MGINGPYVVDSRKQFPFGLGLAGAITKALEYDKKKKPEERRQLRDEAGNYLWDATFMDFDPDARDKTFNVRISAPVQPVVPAMAVGSPIQLVVLEGLQISVSTKVTGKNFETGDDIVRVAFRASATGVTTVKAAGAEGPKAA